MYRYDDVNRISKIVHGDGRDEILYQRGSTACELMMAITNTERDLEFRFFVIITDNFNEKMLQ